MRWILCIAVIVSHGANLTLGDSNVDSDCKYAWCENLGWTNWHDANDGIDGVAVEATFTGGYLWAENVGWICVGDGSPANGVYYANADGSDFGVNIDGNQDLFGLAWGENIGWVNFDTRDKGDERARVDCTESRLRGYVWSESTGWLNLDDDVHFVGGAFCADSCGDSDADEDVDLDDFESFRFCMIGPDDSVPPICDIFDCTLDSDVDLEDFAAFQRSFTGSLP